MAQPTTHNSEGACALAAPAPVLDLDDSEDAAPQPLTEGSECSTSRRAGRVGRWVNARRTRLAQHAEAGLATAEYAIATVAAAGFAALLLAILRSGEVKGMLTVIIERALSFGS